MMITSTIGITIIIIQVTNKTAKNVIIAVDILTTALIKKGLTIKTDEVSV